MCLILKIKTMNLAFIILILPYGSIQGDLSQESETSDNADVDENGVDQSELELQPLVYWPNGTVPFFIDNRHFDSEQALSIMSTLADFTYKTCIKFQPVFALLPGVHILHIANPTGLRKCHFSREGHSTDAPHTLILGYECLASPNIEMMVMRALGFSFEHNRALRDVYIDVLLENIEPGAVDLYTKDLKLPEALRRLPYDPHSVMHFSERENTKNGHRTIMFKSKYLVQSRKALTDGDVRKIQIVYGPECRRRDRAQQLQECQKYATANRRKRDIPLECANFHVRVKRSTSVAKNNTNERKDENVKDKLTVNLRANPEIKSNTNVPKLSVKDTEKENNKKDSVFTKPRSSSKHTLPTAVSSAKHILTTIIKSSFKHTRRTTRSSFKHTRTTARSSSKHTRTTVKRAKITVELQDIVNKINKLKSAAVENAKKTKCETEHINKDGANLSPGIEDIKNSIVEYITKYVHDVTKDALFCSKDLAFKAIERERKSTKHGESKNSGDEYKSTRHGDEERYKSTKHNEMAKSTNLDHKKKPYSTKYKSNYRRAGSTKLPRIEHQNEYRRSNLKSNNDQESNADVAKINGAVLSDNPDHSSKENTPEQGLRSESNSRVAKEENPSRVILSVNADESRNVNERRRRDTAADSNRATNNIGRDGTNLTSKSNDAHVENDNRNESTDTSKVLRFETDSKSLQVVPVKELETGNEDSRDVTTAKQEIVDDTDTTSPNDKSQTTLLSNIDLNSSSKNDTASKTNNQDPDHRRQIIGRYRPAKRDSLASVGQPRVTRIPEYLDQSEEDNFRDYSDRAESNFRRKGSLRTVVLTKGNKDFYSTRKWPDGIVPYIITENMKYDLEDLRSRLGEVNDILKRSTCVRLQEIKERDSKKYENYLVLDPTAEDYVTGKVGGRQVFGSRELFQGGQPRQHTAMMVMSMLGFYLENSRHDRDEYIRVHNRHIRPDKLHHFDKLRAEATLQLPYDFESATHPAWQFWRKPGKTGISSVATFKKLDPTGEVMRSLGQNKQLLSDLDLVKINSVYGTPCMKN